MIWTKFLARRVYAELSAKNLFPTFGGHLEFLRTM